MILELVDESGLHAQDLQWRPAPFSGQTEYDLLYPSDAEHLAQVGVPKDPSAQADLTNGYAIRVLGCPDEVVYLRLVFDIPGHDVLFKAPYGPGDIEVVVAHDAAVVEVVEHGGDEQVASLPCGKLTTVEGTGLVGQPYHVEHMTEVMVWVVEVLCLLEDGPEVGDEVAQINAVVISDDCWQAAEYRGILFHNKVLSYVGL